VTIIGRIAGNKVYLLIAGLVLFLTLLPYQQPDPPRLDLEEMPTLPTAEGAPKYDYLSLTGVFSEAAGIAATPTMAPHAVPTPTITLTETPSPTKTPSPSPRPTSPPATAVASRSVRVPILMYHYVGDLPANPDVYRRDLTVSTATFEAQLKFLQGRGYTSISFDDLLAALEGKQGLPPKPVILTFDDGYRDHFQNAFPLLQRYSFSGTFFIVTDYVGRGPYLSWEEVKAMQDGGMSIQSHGRTHVDLSKLSSQGIADQAEGAAQAIEAHTGRRPRYYAYPSGRYNLEVINIIRAHGYLAAVTTRYGSDHTLAGLMELGRVRVSGGDTLMAFASKLGERP